MSEPDRFEKDHEDLWAAEIETRLARIEQGDFSASDWREALARIRQSLVQGPPA
jgi:hypothetical protein